MATPNPDRTLTLHLRDANTSDIDSHFVLTLLSPSDEVLARVHGDSRYHAFCNLADHFGPAVAELDRKAAVAGTSEF